MIGEWVQMTDGVRRRVVADGESLMLVEVEFNSGAVAPMHNHPHEQITYVVRGRINFTLDGMVYELAAGQSIHIPGGITHGVTAIDQSVLVDAFSPPREDFRR